MNVILVSSCILLAHVRGLLFVENQYVTQQFSAMREKWRNKLVGSGDFEKYPELSEDSHVKAYVEKLSCDASDLYEAMDQSHARRRLWEREGTQTNSADLTTQFTKLNILAKAYGTKGTAMYKQRNVLNVIVSALDFMTQTGRYDGEKYFGNWWDWQIGIPQQFIYILMIVYDAVPRARVGLFVSVMSRYLPSPLMQLYGQRQDRFYNLDFIKSYNSASNRLNQAISVLALGLLIENSEKIDTAIESTDLAFKLVTSDDGFYEDGSFIYHHCIPYAGEYGKHIVKAVGDIFSIVSNYKMLSESETLNRFVKTVEEAYIPLVVDGETMSMVNGRIVSRAPLGEQGHGSEMMYNLLLICALADENNRRVLRQAAKYWMVRNASYYYNNARNFEDLQLTKAVMQDTSLDINTKPFLGSRMYGAMDRFVYSDNDFSLGISMYSDRISAFAAGNGENKKGWHTSDGMVYLYNGDTQFGGTYWPTVDWYRLPGTTVDTVRLRDELSAFDCFRSRERHAGGATDGRDAAVSMQLNKFTFLYKNDFYMYLKAKKSWFVFDGKIICLGTDISGRTDHSIETVIENRLLNPKSAYKFIDQTGNDAKSTTHEVKAYDWFLLKSFGENESIGYVMLDEQTIVTELENRSGTYRDINSEFPSDTQYTGTYQKILVKHGEGNNTKVFGGKYAYITYPNATPNKLDTIKRGTYTIISNSDEFQAVKDNDRKVIGATVWRDSGATVEGIKVDRPANIVYREGTDNTVALSISNPKHTREVIRVELPHAITEVLSKDVGVRVQGGVVLVDTAGARGHTFRITGKVAPKSK